MHSSGAAGSWTEDTKDSDHVSLVSGTGGGNAYDMPFEDSAEKKGKKKPGAIATNAAGVIQSRIPSVHHTYTLSSKDPISRKGIRRNVLIFVSLQLASFLLWLFSFLFDIMWSMFFGLLLVVVNMVWLLLREPAFRRQGCKLAIIRDMPVSVTGTWLYAVSAMIVFVGNFIYDESNSRKKGILAVEITMIGLALGLVSGVATLWQGGASYCCNPSVYSHVTESIEVVNPETGAHSTVEVGDLK